MGNYTCIILDFETTGLSPLMGDRVIEVGAVRLENNQIINRYQSLMNPGMKISSFIEEFTGISNKMLASAPPINEVMHELKNFIGNFPIVAHNASFDSRFLDAEFCRINYTRKNLFACSLLASRRIYTEVPNHKLTTLVKYFNLKTNGIHHRALADAEMTAHLWMKLTNDIKTKYEFEHLSFEAIEKFSKSPKSKLAETMKKQNWS
jgi:DNA polymerase-3 subunit epsilon